MQEHVEHMVGMFEVPRMHETEVAGDVVRKRSPKNQFVRTDKCYISGFEQMVMQAGDESSISGG